MPNSVLLDTSFFIRLLNSNDPLQVNAKVYFKYFLECKIELKISTISIAEYCVKGAMEELPLRNLRIVPFNVDHAIKAGEFARILYANRQNTPANLERILIINDAKLFAQAHCDPLTAYYATSDKRSSGLFNAISKETGVDFKFLNIAVPCHEAFGELDLI